MTILRSGCDAVHLAAGTKNQNERFRAVRSEAYRRCHISFAFFPLNACRLELRPHISGGHTTPHSDTLHLPHIEVSIHY